MSEMSQYGEDLIQLHKHKGLSALEQLIDQTTADEFSGYLLERNVSQEAHEKVLCGEIKSFEELQNHPSSDVYDNSYVYLIKEIGEEETKKYLIDSIHAQ